MSNKPLEPFAIVKSVMAICLASAVVVSSIFILNSKKCIEEEDTQHSNPAFTEEVVRCSAVYVENFVESVESSEITEEVMVEIETCEELYIEEPQGVMIPSNLTAEQLEKGLLYDLKPYSNIFILAEEQTGINAVFLSSVAALESGWGRSEVAKSKNNLFGWTSTTGYYAFNSYEESILYVANKLKELYLTPESPYFNGYSVSDINCKYNGSKFWEDNVISIMQDITLRIVEEEL